MFRALLTMTSVFVLMLISPAGTPDNSKASAKNAPVAASRVFELRTYYTNEGKLDDLHTRFRDHTCSLFKKHGAELIGFWTPLDDDKGKGGKLVYMLAFPSRDAAKKMWEDFGKDPEWRKAYAESRKNGALVKKVESIYLEPTDYSEMK
jgi:NIPSNAP